MPDYHSVYGGGSSPRNSAAGRGKWRFDDDEPTTAKRVRGRRTLPSIERFDAIDGLPDGDRWSTWTSPRRPNAGRGPTRTRW